MDLVLDLAQHLDWITPVDWVSAAIAGAGVILMVLLWQAVRVRHRRRLRQDIARYCPDPHGP